MVFLKKKTAVSSNEAIQIFDALGDATRFRIMSILLQRDDICVSELAEEVKISTPGVSQQLKTLERSGLLERKRMGQKICYRLRSEDRFVRSALQLIKSVEAHK